MPFKHFLLLALLLQSALAAWTWLSGRTTCAAGGNQQCTAGRDQDLLTEHDRAVPLVLTTNAKEEAGTGCWRIPAGDRGELYLHPDGARAILSANCPEGIALVSWNGYARGGKSFMAGEFTMVDRSLDRNFSSHFALGHEMDSCSKGIFISSVPVPHPQKSGVCIFQVDVEGLDAVGVESSMQSDSELAIFTYLTSSTWIFNSRGVFDAHSLDLLLITTNLAENMDIGDRSLLRLPIFHWVLQNVHLKPTVDGKEVSPQDYFQHMLSTYDKPFHKKGSAKEAAKQRNEIREAIQRSFQVPHRVTALAPVSSDSDILRQLPYVARNHEAISPQFVSQLDYLKQDVLSSVSPVQLQRAHKLITASGETLLQFMNSTLDYLNRQQPVPVFDAVDTVIQMQIDKAKINLLNSWRDCVRSHLASAAAEQQERMLNHTRNLSGIEQVSLPYWSEFLRENVSRFLGRARIPVEQPDLLAIHQGCYRVALAKELEPLNEESHDVQTRLVNKVEQQLGIGKHENDAITEISGLKKENDAEAEKYNKDLVEILWEPHILHLRTRFQAVVEEDFVDMLRVLDDSYTKLSAGPNAHKVYSDNKPKFISQAESYVAFGKTFRKMEQRHDEEIAVVRRQMEKYQSELTRLHNEYDTLNAERGRLQREMDLQADQHQQIIKRMQASLKQMNDTNSKLEENQWQLRQQLDSQIREQEAAINSMQREAETRQQELMSQQQVVSDQLQQKQSELNELSSRMDQQAHDNQLLREELRRLNEQECGTRKVTACTGAYYGGTCQDLAVSWWSHCSLINAGLPDNSIRSARIPPGCSFTVFADSGYNGQQATFTSDTPDIQSYVNGVSSARVF